MRKLENRPKASISAFLCAFFSYWPDIIWQKTSISFSPGNISPTRARARFQARDSFPLLPALRSLSERARALFNVSRAHNYCGTWLLFFDDSWYSCLDIDSWTIGKKGLLLLFNWSFFKFVKVPNFNEVYWWMFPLGIIFFISFLHIAFIFKMLSL